MKFAVAFEVQGLRGSKFKVVLLLDATANFERAIAHLNLELSNSRSEPFDFLRGSDSVAFAEDPCPSLRGRDVQAFVGHAENFLAVVQQVVELADGAVSHVSRHPGAACGSGNFDSLRIGRTDSNQFLPTVNHY